jgi:isoleucyl-tRNA synthetase
MRANLPERELHIQAFWQERGIYQELVRLGRDRPKFILHDGPPYANGDIHTGTALNKVLKDIVIKFHSLQGQYAPYIPGWDTHGLPIELQAIRALGIDRRQITPLELRRRCREFALHWLDIQRADFRRLGVLGDWDHPYLTMDPGYEAIQIRLFGELVERGYIYKGLKPVYWCAECETALAEAEVEYADKTSDSIYVAFAVEDGKGLLPTGARVVIWTTTPWTIPANLAIALHPDAGYQLVATTAGALLLAAELTAAALAAMGLAPGQVLGSFRGKELEGIVCRHPLYPRPSPLTLGDHVTLEEGTGCVHTAPGHGHEDFELGARYGLPVLNPLDGRGVFTDEAGPFAGLRYDRANPAIVEALARAGALLGCGRLQHQYAHCWRCKEPVLYRATEQWFASVAGFREKALAAIDEVTWIPAWGRERIFNMVSDRGDWCISRQRAWGVPIPAFYCRACGDILMNRETIDSVARIFQQEGSDAWFAREAHELLPEGITCIGCGGSGFDKENDIMDVWFDSGSSHAAAMRAHPELGWPADLYLEGSDQHRGWFQSSLLTAVATEDRAPYRAVLTHGFVVDGEGRKMSKSLGNVVSPQAVIGQYGADILRLWVASSDYKQDIRVSPDILKQLAEGYRKIRNTLRFILGNLYDYDPVGDAFPGDQLSELDLWALDSLERLIQEVTASYQTYDYHLVYHAIHNFCAVDMSALYLDVLKDTLYTMGKSSRERRAAQHVLYQVAAALVRLLAPVIPHTAEEVWGQLRRLPGEPDSVLLASWPPVRAGHLDAARHERWQRLLSVRRVVSRALELERAARHIGSSLEGQVTLYADSDQHQLLQQCLAFLPNLFIVSAVKLAPPDQAPPAQAVVDAEAKVSVVVEKADGVKCERCWVFSETVSHDPGHPALCRRCAQVVRQAGAGT